MILRSSCSKQCTATTLQSKRGQRHSHHHQHHQEELQDTEKTMSRSWSRSEQMAHHDAMQMSSSKAHIYDSDEEEEQPKTDYTYIRSGFYSSRVPPDYVTEKPNMSRRKLHSCHQLNETYFCSSSSGNSEESMELARSATRVVHQNVVNTTRYMQSQSQASLFAYGSSGILRPVQSAPAQVVKNGLMQSTNTTSSDSYHNTSVDKSDRSLIRVCVRKIASLWHRVWRCVYIFVCRVLVWDTWLLSKCWFLRSWKALLPLLVVLFFLVYALSPHGIFHRSASSSHDHLSSSLQVNLISSDSVRNSFIANWMDWQWFQFQKDDNSDLITSLQDSEVTRSWYGSFWDWLPFMTHTRPWENLLSSMKPETPLDLGLDVTRTSVNVNVDVHVSEELNVLRKEMMAFTSQLLDLTKATEELRGSLSQKMAYLQEQSKVLSAEIGVLKDRVQSLENRRTVDDFMKSFTEENKNIRDDLRRLEKDFQLYALSMKNCCYNHSALLLDSEKHFSNILFQVMHEQHGDRSAFPASSSFREWLTMTFVGHEALASAIASLEGRVAKNMSAIVKQTMEDTSSSSSVGAGSHLHISQLYPNTSLPQGNWISRDEVHHLIENKLALYDADKTGMVDYALESAGGTVISTRCAETYSVRIAQYSIFGIPIWHGTNSPRTVIQPEVHPGQCWAFRGGQGYLVIGLAAPIRPTAFSLEHIPKSLSVRGNIDSAPRDFSVWGLTHEDDYDGKLLGQYSYSQDGPPLQHFLVKDPNPGVFPIIELRILNNHGNMEYTCIYRFRVHGKKA